MWETAFFTFLILGAGLSGFLFYHRLIGEESASPTHSGLPHERYPEILNWRVGDRIRNYIAYDTIETNVYYYGVTQQGTVIWSKFPNGELEECSLGAFMNGAVNTRLKQEFLSAKLADNKEYQTVLEETRKMLDDAGLLMKKPK
jgi:hypothetical protein